MYTAGEKPPPVYGSGEIPRRYNIDTLVVMPVNADTSFIYWEVTDELIEQRCGGPNAELVVRVFEGGSEVCSFSTGETVGKHYIKYPASFRPLAAEIGIRKDGGFVALLKTKTVSGHRPVTEGLWMERREAAGTEVWIPLRDGPACASPRTASAFRRIFGETARSGGRPASSTAFAVRSP